MNTAHRFLIVDDDLGERRRLVSALRLKFPDATLDECDGREVAAKTARADEFAVVITHEAKESRGLPAVWEFRDLNRHTPLILISDRHRRETAMAAGANELLHCDEWSQIGEVVQSVLASRTDQPMYRQYA